MRCRHARLAVAAACLTFALASSRDASAFVAKHAPGGQPVRWAQSHVDFVLSSSLEDVSADAANAIARAQAGWAGNAGAPSLGTRPGGDDATIGYDGTNTILYSDHFAPAGRALAVTVLTYEDATGNILDADIVVNGGYTFAVLSDDARAGSGVAPVSTEGGGSVKAKQPFDLVHVLAHETGHALGLSDEPAQKQDLMFPYTLPGDASQRVPSSDDLAGVKSLYVTSDNGGAGAPATGSDPTASSSSSSSSTASAAAPGAQAGGCAMGAAPVGGGFASLVFLGAAVIAPFARRRVRAASRAALLGAGLFLGVTSMPVRAQATNEASANAVVTAAQVVVRDGLFTTDLTLAVRDCSGEACPAEAHLTVLGGSVAGITQEIGGVRAPAVGDLVPVRFVAEKAAIVAE